MLCSAIESSVFFCAAVCKLSLTYLAWASYSPDLNIFMYTCNHTQSASTTITSHLVATLSATFLRLLVLESFTFGKWPAYRLVLAIKHSCKSELTFSRHPPSPTSNCFVSNFSHSILPSFCYDFCINSFFFFFFCC